VTPLLLGLLLSGTPKPATPPKARCDEPRLVVKGDTLASLATECYGGRAWAGLLEQALERSSTRLTLGTTVTLPTPRALVTCTPAELCGPLLTAWDALRAVQGQTQHVKAVPASAQPGLRAAVKALEQTRDAAEAARRHDLGGQLRGALDELTQLEQGHNPEPGYHEETCHQHLAIALERLASRVRVLRSTGQGPASPAVDGHVREGESLQVGLTAHGPSHAALVLLEGEQSTVLLEGAAGRLGRGELNVPLALQSPQGKARGPADGARLVALFAGHPIVGALAVTAARHETERRPDLQLESLTLHVDR
jgi:hypothetical protein